MRQTDLTDIEAPGSAPEALLAPGTHWGPLHLAVTDAERARLFWTRYVGLQPTTDPDSLGTGGKTLIVLEPGASGPVVPRRTGLYHVALHVTDRRELARLVARLYSLKYENSPTDHTMSETTYLWDPDGNGIEITLETPERGEFVVLPSGSFGARTTDGRITSGRDPVDLDSLFGELRPDEDLMQPLAAGTRIGHVHLHVSHLGEAKAFYQDAVGFRPEMHMPGIGMTDFSFPDVTFRHSLALNTWSGVGAQGAPAGTAGLRHFELVMPTRADFEALHARLSEHGAAPTVDVEDDVMSVADPAGNRLLVSWQR